MHVILVNDKEEPVETLTRYAHEIKGLGHDVEIEIRAADAEPAETITVQNLEVNLVFHTAQLAGEPVELQPLEYRLLEYLLRNRGRTVSRTEIMEKVWHYTFDPKTNLIETCVSRLRAKVDPDRRHKLLYTIKGQGYRIN